MKDIVPSMANLAQWALEEEVVQVLRERLAVAVAWASHSEKASLLLLSLREKTCWMEDRTGDKPGESVHNQVN